MSIATFGALMGTAAYLIGVVMGWIMRAIVCHKMHMRSDQPEDSHAP